MIGLPSLSQLDRAATVRIWWCTAATDMRRGFDGLAEQQMKRIALLRKNALFVGTSRGGATAAVISSLTSTCQRHGVNPQAYLTQLLANLLDTPMSRLDDWLPDQWKKRSSPPAPADSSPQHPQQPPR